MYQTINIDKAAEHVKNVVDTNRCAICDKSDGTRMRYPCGHTSCDDCVSLNEEICPICLIPPKSSTFPVPLIDKPYTQRSQNADNLLNSFETEFGVDVYKKIRLSQQLKVERELFPQCIQAPAKYYNKRKSSMYFTENKENKTSFFPGEETSLSSMDKSNENVRKWLNKFVTRKPLGDLNHSRTINTVPKQPLKVINTQNKDRTRRKRNHSQLWADENQTYTDEYDVTPSKKYNKENKIEKTEINTGSSERSTDLQKSKNKDDSGISIEDDGAIVIDDSQSVRVDKDMNAWLAVLEAEKNAHSRSSTLWSQESDTRITQPHNILAKVPFYLKSPLSENCKHCSHSKLENNDVKSEHPNISITVESKSFTAIINVSRAERVIIPNAKHSVEVQTDKLQNIDDLGFVDESIGSENERDITVPGSPVLGSSKSDDIFSGEANHFGPLNRSVKKSSNVVIAESDSDEDVEHSISLKVTADVHRSYDETLVLGDVEDLQEHNKRTRRAARGHTPTSTDSSDKENYNPNRKKRPSSSKKKPLKK